MLKITEFKREGESYIRFDWNGGFLEMKKDKYEKLSKKKKAIIFSAVEK